MAERSRIFTAGSLVRLRLASDEWLVASLRRGDIAAFEALYERHSSELLAFCVYMLGSRQDGEDAVQATFASAYRALRADKRPIALRPWLFAISRNECLSILRRRRPVVELTGDVAQRGDPLEELEVREEVRRVFQGLRELPECQRAALILAEVHGLSQAEIGTVLGVRAEQVKAYIYQARSALISERRAREANCLEIREELASARGAALLRGRLRRHIRSCKECKVYADGVARHRRQLGALLPVAPLMLRFRAIEEALGIGGTDPSAYAGQALGGATVELAGGGLTAVLVKVAAGVAAIGASAGVGVSVLATPSGVPPAGSSASSTETPSALIAPGSSARPAGLAGIVPASSRALQVGGEDTGSGATPAPGAGGGEKLELSNAQGGTPVVPGTDGSSVAPGGEGVIRGETRGAGHERSARSGGTTVKGEAARTAAQERQQRQGEHQRASEARRRARETKSPKSASGGSRSEEERIKIREERRKAHEGEGPETGSGAPRTEEERRKAKEEHQKAKEEREAKQAPSG